jgi:hypothetical protein
MPLFDLICETAGFPPSFWTGLGIAVPVIGGGIKWAYVVEERTRATEKDMVAVKAVHQEHSQKLDTLLQGMARIEGRLGPATEDRLK